jgi:uncharacterized membrane protein
MPCNEYPHLVSVIPTDSDRRRDIATIIRIIVLLVVVIIIIIIIIIIVLTVIILLVMTLPTVHATFATLINRTERRQLVGKVAALARPLLLWTLFDDS